MRSRRGLRTFCCRVIWFEGVLNEGRNGQNLRWLEKFTFTMLKIGRGDSTRGSGGSLCVHCPKERTHIAGFFGMLAITARVGRDMLPKIDLDAKEH